MAADLSIARRVVWLRRAALVAAAIFAAIVIAWFLMSTIPRRIVLATGPLDGLHHELAQRYQAILARNGVTVVERVTSGAEENAKLLRDPRSGVDVAFMLGGVVRANERSGLEMLAALYFEPLWVFYRGDATLVQLDELRYKRIAIGTPGQGVYAFVEPLFAANNITGFNSELVPIGNVQAVRALQEGRVDAICLLGAVTSPAVYQALHDKELKLMGHLRAEAYERRYPYVTRLTLPPGTVDLALRIPEREVQLFATEAMLVAREGLAPAIADLFIEAARELHAGRGYFERRTQFPNTEFVDLPVSVEADRHLRFGPSLLQRHLPFFVATYVERLVILLVPLLFLLVPLANWLPQLLRWRSRSRVYHWYGKLALLERDVGRRQGELPIERWLAELDRIEHAAASIRLPSSMASEGYTLREHVALVRNAILGRREADRGTQESPDP
ncbi:MAG: TAXI family TRAP transporter solute-binding subunit [Betaproteobacteria bacterium]